VRFFRLEVLLKNLLAARALTLEFLYLGREIFDHLGFLGDGVRDYCASLRVDLEHRLAARAFHLEEHPSKVAPACGSVTTDPAKDGCVGVVRSARGNSGEVTQTRVKGRGSTVFPGSIKLVTSLL
jgi:hypothetical protein